MISGPLKKRLAAAIDNYTNAEGQVDYSAVDLADNVKEYVAALPEYDLSTLGTREEKIAFWINTYNALSMHGALEAIAKDPRFLENGHEGLWHRVRFFFTTKHNVGDERLSLNDIEKKLRFDLHEPRVHFALVCGAESCPPLKGGLYSASGLDHELDMAAKIFVNSPNGLIVERDQTRVRLSRVFKWYGRDFAPDEPGVLRYLSEFHRDGDYIRENADRLAVEYMGYDWRLNRA